MAETKTGLNPVLKWASVDDIKAAIRNAIQEANAERTMLAAEIIAVEKNPFRDPRLDPAVGMIERRLKTWEDAQDTLWEWLKIKNGQA